MENFIWRKMGFHGGIAVAAIILAVVGVFLVKADVTLAQQPTLVTYGECVQDCTVMTTVPVFRTGRILQSVPIVQTPVAAPVVRSVPIRTYRYQRPLSPIVLAEPAERPVYAVVEKEREPRVVRGLFFDRVVMPRRADLSVERVQ